MDMLDSQNRLWTINKGQDYYQSRAVNAKVALRLQVEAASSRTWQALQTVEDIPTSLELEEGPELCLQKHDLS
jgi:hypothetical protein